MNAHDICLTAAKLVNGERSKQHGEALENHRNIAELWTAYRGITFSPHDVAVMMALLKIARTKTGTHNPDDYVDGAAYLGLAGQFAEGK